MSTSTFFSISSRVAAVVFVTAAYAIDIPFAKLSSFAPLPPVATSPTNPITEEKITLGRMLYFEPRLSRSQTLSCNSCHDLAKYGVDAGPTSTGFKGQHGNRNAPTVFNAAAHFVQFWDGRAADVEAQATGPMMNPVEMAMPSGKEVVEVLASIPEYVQLFHKAFPGDKDPVSLNNAGKAIGAFERKLMTPSRWDAFLKGDANALTDDEKTGFLKFADAGCAACHNGALVGGNSYKKLGVKKNWPDNKDQGRVKVSKDSSDKFVFKVPSLRNIVKTGPYFHNGSIPTLDVAIMKMSEYQLGKPLSEPDVKAIVAWMNTLTGPLPTEYIQPPTLPPGTDKTPKPMSD
jgi:cytochrome c peroxidase